MLVRHGQTAWNLEERSQGHADISLDADAARLLVWRVADLVDRHEPFGVAASKAKLFASEAAVRAANLAIQIHGGAGYVDEYPAAKYLRAAGAPGDYRRAIFAYNHAEWYVAEVLAKANRYRGARRAGGPAALAG